MGFIQFGSNDTIVDSEAVTAPLFSNSVYTLPSSSMYTSSIQEAANLSYLNVYNLAVAATGSELQYSLAYGHLYGSGSAPYNTAVPQYTPTRNVYGQLRNLVYGDESGSFNFGTNSATGSRDIYVVNMSRARYKESLYPGSLNLTLGSGSNLIKLTDNSNDVSVATYVGSLRVYNIVSGSSGYSYNGTAVQTNSGSYGLFIPDISTIVLNPRALALGTADGGISFVPNETNSLSYSASYNRNNSELHKTLFRGSSFSLSSYETVSSRYYLSNVGFNDFNYTTNPSIIDDSGNILYTSLINNPETFITGIGLYTAQGDLVAVAKLSKPLKKNFTSPLTLRIKLQA